LLESEKVTMAAGVPTVWQMLLGHLQQNQLRFSTLKRTVIGGSACPPAMIHAFNETYGVTVLHAWGMTEMSPLGTVCTLKNPQLALPPEEQTKVLLKQGKLTESEYRQMQSHAQIGSDILARSHSSLLQLASEIAASHHERWDGQGYPNRLVGDAIPISGRIVCIADNFDALTTERPYKPAWTFERTVEHILGRAGTQFDPDCVAAFERALPRIKAIMEQDRLEQAQEAEKAIISASERVA